jgi:hypothetical protein
MSFFEVELHHKPGQGAKSNEYPSRERSYRTLSLTIFFSRQEFAALPRKLSPRKAPIMPMALPMKNTHPAERDAPLTYFSSPTCSLSPSGRLVGDDSRVVA